MDGAMTRRGLLRSAACGATGVMLAARTAGAATVRPAQVVGRVRRIDPALDAAVPADAPVTLVTRGFTWCEGPVWIERAGMLLFSDVPENVMYRWSAAGGLGIFKKPSGLQGSPDPAFREPGSNGLAIDERGGLVMASSGGRCIARVDLRTRAITVLADSFRGKRFNSPNDLIVAADGAIYFTDPPYGLKDGDRSPIKQMPFNGVYRWSREAGVTLIDDGLTLPNGVGLSPDERILYVSVSDPDAPRIYAYDLDKAGRAANRRVFFDAQPLARPGVAGLPDGMTVDARGRILVAGPGGLLVISPAGILLGVIEVPGKTVSNCVFGGSDGKSLFMTAGDLVARVPVRARGL